MAAEPRAPRRRTEPWLLSLPALLLIWMFFMLPIGGLIAESVIAERPDGGRGFTLAAYQALFSDRYNLDILWRTLHLSFLSTVVSLVVAFPVAIFLRQASPRLRSIVSLLLIAPLLMSVVVRTLAWVFLLGPKGVVNAALTGLGLPQMELMYNEFGVLVGLSQVFLSYMILSISTSTMRIDENLLAAASNLGANRWRVLWYVVLPLSLPGMLAGSILVFTMAASAYATPVLLGGSKVKVMASEVYDLAINYADWPAASAMSLVLLILVAVVVWLGTRLLDRNTRGLVAR